MKYSSNLADYCSLKQSNVIGQVYIEQEHVFNKFQTVNEVNHKCRPCRYCSSIPGQLQDANLLLGLQFFLKRSVP